MQLSALSESFRNTVQYVDCTAGGLVLGVMGADVHLSRCGLRGLAGSFPPSPTAYGPGYWTGPILYVTGVCGQVAL